MTPMQKLKNQFDDFKSLLPKEFKELSLNFAEEKITHTSFCGDYTAHINKGVKSDFIKLYQLKYSNKDSWSIGFAFDYLKDNENLVQVSLKEGTANPMYFNGNVLELKEFKVKFIETINKIKSKENITAKEIFNVFKQDFDLLPKVRKKVRSRNK